MIRLFFVWLALFCQLIVVPRAHATVLQDEAAPSGRPRVGAIIIAPNMFIDKWAKDNLLDTVMVADAEAKRLGEAARGKLDYVEVLTGTEATALGVRGTLTRLRNEQLAYIYVFLRGFSFGGDYSEPCLILTDWSSEDSENTCFKVYELSGLVDQIAPNAVIVLDTSIESKAFQEKFNLATIGPTASNWPNNRVPVISAASERGYVNCSALFPLFTEIMTELQPGMTLGDLDKRVNELAPSYQARCGTSTRFRPRFENDGESGWKLNDPFFPAPTVEEPQQQVVTPPVLDPLATLPTELKPETVVPGVKTELPKKGFLDTVCVAGRSKNTAIGLGVTSGALTALSVTSGILLNGVMQQVDTQEERNALGQEKLDKLSPMRGVYGITTIASASAAAVTLTGAATCGEPKH